MPPHWSSGQLTWRTFAPMRRPLAPNPVAAVAPALKIATVQISTAPRCGTVRCDTKSRSVLDDAAAVCRAGDDARHAVTAIAAAAAAPAGRTTRP